VDPTRTADEGGRACNEPGPGAISPVMSAFVPLADLVPGACIGCDVRLPPTCNDTTLCPACAAASPLFTPEERRARGVWAVAAFTGPLAAAYARYKDAGELRGLPAFARLLATAPPLRARGVYDAVTAVPAFAVRRFVRGFDPAGALARAAVAAAGFDAPWLRGLRRAKRWGRRQRGLRAAERRRNVQAGFVVRDAAAVAGARLLLVDDVVTTGATLAAARRALLDAGAAAVDRLALFRADL